MHTSTLRKMSNHFKWKNTINYLTILLEFKKIIEDLHFNGKPVRYLQTLNNKINKESLRPKQN